MAQGDLASVVRGTMGLKDAPSTLRIYEKDKAAQPFFRYRGATPFVNTLITNKLGKKGVTDIEFISYEQDEEPVVMVPGTLTSPANACMVVDATTINYIDIGFTDATAAYLQPGVTLTLENVNMSISGSVTTYTRKTNALIQDVNTPAFCEVVNVGIAGGGGSSITRVRVMMAHALMGGTQSGLTGAASAVCQIGGVDLVLTTDSIIRGARTNFDTGAPGYSITLNPDSVTNYLQIFEKPFSTSELERNVRKFAIKDPMKYLFKKASWGFTREIERAFLFQGQGFSSDRGGKAMGNTRSVNSVITAAKRITIGEETLYGLDEALRPFSEVGEQNPNRWVFASPYWLNKTAGLFQQYFEEHPMSGEKGFGYTVTTYTDKMGCTYNFVYSREMGVSARFNKSAFVVNMDYVNYAYLAGQEKSFDVYVDDGEGNGLQEAGAKEKKEQLRAIIGLDIRFVETHGELKWAS